MVPSKGSTSHASAFLAAILGAEAAMIPYQKIFIGNTMYYNFHTHHQPQDSTETAILNCYPEDILPASSPCSIGLHPWHVDKDWQEKVDMVRSKAQADNVWAIGECGLDKVRGGDLSTQIQAFSAQLQIARELHKPVIVHCVKAYDELLHAITNDDHIIIHGFRGKWQQAKQIIAKGALLSFGNQYNLETLRFVYSSNTPFFLETDDLRLSVRQIYEQVGHHLDVDVSHLVRLCDPRQICGRLP